MKQIIIYDNRCTAVCSLSQIHVAKIISPTRHFKQYIGGIDYCAGKHFMKLILFPLLFYSINNLYNLTMTTQQPTYIHDHAYHHIYSFRIAIFLCSHCAFYRCFICPLRYRSQLTYRHARTYTCTHTTEQSLSYFILRQTTTHPWHPFTNMV